jgi:hypothetical protein
MSMLRTLRRHGFVKTAQIVAYRLAQRLMVIDITHLMILAVNDVVAPAVRDGLTFDSLTPAEVYSLCKDGTNGLDTSLADRMSSHGDFCFAAFAKDRLAGYAWFAFDRVAPECNRAESLLTGVGMSFPASMCFPYKGFVLREFRGGQVYGHLMSQAATRLAGRNVTRILSTADWMNFAAHQSCY